MSLQIRQRRRKHSFSHDSHCKIGTQMHSSEETACQEKRRRRDKWHQNDDRLWKQNSKTSQFPTTKSRRQQTLKRKQKETRRDWMALAFSGILVTFCVFCCPASSRSSAETLACIRTRSLETLKCGWKRDCKSGRRWSSLWSTRFRRW